VPAVFALVCAIFGTTFLAIKVGVDAGAPPFCFAATRFVIAGAALALLLLATKRTSLRDLARLAPRAALLSLPYIVVNFGATFWAEQHIGSGTAAQLDAAGPAATALLAAIFLRKRPGPRRWAGIGLGIAGLMLVARSSPAASSPGLSSPGDGGDMSLIASLVMLAGVVGLSGASILYKRLFGEGDDPFAVNALNMFFGGLGLGALSWAAGEGPFPAGGRPALALLYLVVAGSLVGHSANLWLVKRAGPVLASSWFFVSPIIATGVGSIFLGERLEPLGLLGAAIALSGVLLVFREDTRREDTRREDTRREDTRREDTARADARRAGFDTRRPEA